MFNNCKYEAPVTTYAIKCNANGKIYVGSTIDLKRRIYEHQYQAKQIQLGNWICPNGITQMSKDIETFGWQGFQWYVIEENVPFEERREKEKYWIARYSATDPEKGYNTRSEKRVYENVGKIVHGLP